MKADATALTATANITVTVITAITATVQKPALLKKRQSARQSRLMPLPKSKSERMV